MATLYELVGEYKKLYAMMEDGEIDDEIFRDTLSAMELDKDLEGKAAGYACVMRQIKADETALSEEISRLTDRRTTLKKRLEGLKLALKDAMITLNKKSISTPLFSLSIRAAPARLVVDDIERLREYPGFWKPRKWDESELVKTNVRNALECGELDGAVHLEQDKILVIK